MNVTKILFFAVYIYMYNESFFAQSSKGCYDHQFGTESLYKAFTLFMFMVNIFVYQNCYKYA